MQKQKKIAQLIIARLDGKDIDKRFKYYQSLVQKGIGGFIVFDGRLKEVRNGIKKLQRSAEIPLFIASDLEQGLGQQIEGGTLFPPAMAVGQAINPENKKDIKLLRKSVSIIVQEAKAAGFNVIFSPVLDVNTNPENPIICTRAFSDNPAKVAWFGNEFIKGFQKQGVIACAKHFPGHGDTIKDSHKELPVVNADIKRLQHIEIYPFYRAVKAGVKMIMVGHLKVPVLDPKLPSSISKKIIQGFLKDKMKFKGLVITDAMNMHAVSGKSQNKEAKACLTAINAGADILLHPDKPEKIIDYLSLHWDKIIPRVEDSFQKIVKAKKGIIKSTAYSIGTKTNRDLAYKLTQKSIKVIPSRPPLIKWGEKGLKEPVVLIIDDDNSRSGNFLAKTIKDYHKQVNPVRKLGRRVISNWVKTIYVDNKSRGSIKSVLDFISDKTLIAAVFSQVSAWKGRSGISRKLNTLLKRAVHVSQYSVVAGFCCPYVLKGLKTDVIIEAYSGSEQVQEAVAKILCAPHMR